MALDAGEATVRIGADTTDVESGSERSVGAIHKLTDSVNSFKEGLKNIGEAVAFDYLKDKIVDLVEQMGELGDETENVAAKLGITTEMVGQLQYIAESSGSSLDAVAMGMERLGVNAERAAAGSKVEADAFDRLGVKVKDGSGNLKSLNELMLETADSFSSHADGIGKTTLAIQLFGRAGAQMIPELDLGRAGFQALMDKADSLGGTLSGPTTAALKAVHDNIVDLDTATRGLEARVVALGAPAITDLLGYITRLISGLSEWVGQSNTTKDANTTVSQSIAVVAASVLTLIQAFRDLWDVVSPIIYSLGVAFGDLALTMYDMSTQNWLEMAQSAGRAAGDIKNSFTGAFSDLTKSTSDYMTTLNDMFSKVPKLASTIEVTGGGGAQYGGMDPTGISPAMKAAEKATKEAATQMEKTVGEVQKTFQTFFSSIISGFDSAITGLITGTKTWQQAMFTVIDSVWKQLVTMGENWLAKWLANEAAMLVAHQTSQEAMVAADKLRTGSEADDMITNALKAIFVSSKQTAAGVTANLAPTMGPLAIPAGVAAGAATIAENSLDVGSWNIPQDQTAQVHAGEAVVPKAGGMADAFRSLAGAISDNGGGSLGGGTTVNFNGPVMDAAGLAAVVTQHYNDNPSARPGY